MAAVLSTLTFHSTTPVLDPHSSNVSVASDDTVMDGDTSPSAMKHPPLWLAYLHFVRQTDGRDKLLKLIQYALKVLLWRALSRPSDAPLRRRLKALVSTFSTTRKVIRLGHWMEPGYELQQWLSEGSTTTSTTTAATLARLWEVVPLTLGIANDLFDDIYCLCRVRCLPRQLEAPAEKWSLRCWFTGIWLDLYASLREQRTLAAKINAQQHTVDQLHATSAVHCSTTEEQVLAAAEHTLATLQQKQYWLRISAGKMLGDLCFCSYDIFRWQFSDGWPALTGLLSGLLSSHKLWHKTVSTMM